MSRQARLAAARWLALALLPLSVLMQSTHVFAAASVPDFSGVWLINNPPVALRTTQGRPPLLLAEGERLYAERMAARAAQRKALDGTARCLPPGVPRIYLQRMPFEVQQEAGAMNLLFQWNHIVRVVDLGVTHDRVPSVGASHAGAAVGRFVGDELQIDTIGFNDATWLDDSGLPHSGKLHLVEHWKLDEGGQRLNINIDVDDPIYYAESWNFALSFRRLPRTTAIEEDVCVERQGLVSQSGAVNQGPAIPAPVIPEPPKRGAAR